jgi:hypothetical protein
MENASKKTSHAEPQRRRGRRKEERMKKEKADRVEGYLQFASSIVLSSCLCVSAALRD